MLCSSQNRKNVLIDNFLSVVYIVVGLFLTAFVCQRYSKRKQGLKALRVRGRRRSSEHRENWKGRLMGDTLWQAHWLNGNYTTTFIL